MTANPPLPYRFKSTSLRFQIPSLTGLFPNVKFFEEMRKTQAFKTLAQFLFTLRTWTRRTIWGDRVSVFALSTSFQIIDNIAAQLFLQFRGPSTILIQSRAGRLSHSLTTRDVNEIADTPAGAVQDAITLDMRKESGHGSTTSSAAGSEAHKEKVTYAEVGADGKVKFGEQ